VVIDVLFGYKLKHKIMKKAIVVSAIMMLTQLTHAQENQKKGKENNSSKQVAETEFPATYFKNYTGTTSISKKEIMNMDTIKVHAKDGKGNLKTFTVVSYNFTAGLDGKDANTDNKTLFCKGQTLTKENRELLKQIAPGSKVFIDNVTAIDSKGKTVKAAGLTLNVK